MTQTETAFIPRARPSHHADGAVLPLRYNHPKNYVGALLAVASADQTADRTPRNLIEEHIVSDSDAAIRGAIELGLLEASPRDGEKPTVEPTPLGNSTITAVTDDRGLEGAISALGRLHGRRGRFVDVGSRYWEPILTTIYQAYTPARELVTTLDTVGPATLAEFAAVALRNHTGVAEYLLNTPLPDAPSRGTPLEAHAISDSSVYYSPAICQLKSQLWHAGILTERGVHSESLDPLADRWAIEPRHISIPHMEGDR